MKKSGLQRVCLGLGSNVGDRAGMLHAALEALDRRADIRVLRVSRLYETAPVGKVDQADFLNLAAEIETALEPLELLNAVKEIEVGLGRTAGPRWGPREIDIDIILWGALVVATEELTIPHSAFRDRAFVLVPLAEIAGDAVDPVTGLRVSELTAKAQGVLQVAGDQWPVTAWSHVNAGNA